MLVPDSALYSIEDEIALFTILREEALNSGDRQGAIDSFEIITALGGMRSGESRPSQETLASPEQEPPRTCARPLDPRHALTRVLPLLHPSTQLKLQAFGTMVDALGDDLCCAKIALAAQIGSALEGELKQRTAIMLAPYEDRRTMIPWKTHEPKTFTGFWSLWDFIEVASRRTKKKQRWLVTRAHNLRGARNNIHEADLPDSQWKTLIASAGLLERQEITVWDWAIAVGTNLHG